MERFFLLGRHVSLMRKVIEGVRIHDSLPPCVPYPLWEWIRQAREASEASCLPCHLMIGAG